MDGLCRIQDDPDSSSDSESQANIPFGSTNNSLEEDIDVGNVSDIQQPNHGRASLHVSVQREAITSTQMREAEDELLDLDIDVYDQQTYEKSVFDQVDKAITQAAPASQKTQAQDATEKNPSNINDLLRVIHDQSDTEDKTDEQEACPRDEQILQLARQQRLNRISQIKQERQDHEASSQMNLLNSMPSIPRLSNSSTTALRRSGATVDSTSTSKNSVLESQPLERKPSTIRTIKHDDDSTPCPPDSPSSPESSSDSEYKPPGEHNNVQSGIEDEDIDYESNTESDSDIGENERTEGRVKKVRDDGDFKSYSNRVKAYVKERAKIRLGNIQEDGTELNTLDEIVTIDGNLKLLKSIWDNLYEHQKTGVRWLWELHQLGTGGILGDEMGLGKTIQMIAFLTALKCSNVVNYHNGYRNLGPVVLVCPATVMHQWLVEFRKWYPPFRVAILHSTGSFGGDREQLVKVIHKSNGILICSFPGVVIYQDYLHALDWHYAILDEGHKIRNPDAQVTLACKRFRTPHRLILSGSPVQNNLRELWSIFDFIYPGKLGTLPVFMGQFGIPITQGGYANATDIQVQIAYKCACVLRDTIKPFLLRRTKAEVNNKLKLPERSEQVLFCKLTEKQRKAYEQFLQSPTVRDIKQGRCQIFVGLIQLRKICNHPDLFDPSECIRQVKQKNEEKSKRHSDFFSTDETYGHYQKSGKMMVVDALLRLWKKQGHKVLLFTQSRQMLKIFADYLKELNFKYLFMDGLTPIGTRHTLIDEFNANNDIFIFLLTTRVGGVGVNLIGANRIIIYDPDWNPSTDIQARERAWRIGQQRHVIIYRLLTAGTIEEKIYHRQVFKLYLTNRILKDAKQKRFFKTNDMHELFTLGHDEKNIETKALFEEDLHIDEKSIKKSRSKHKAKKHKRRKRASEENSAEPGSTPVLSEERVREMREQAKRLSQMIANQYGNQADDGSTALNGTRVKMEQTTSTEEIISNSRSQNQDNSLRVDPSTKLEDISHNPMSPTQPIPYCPAWLDNAADSSVPTTSSASGDVPRMVRFTKQHVEYLVKQDVYNPGAGAEEAAETVESTTTNSTGKRGSKSKGYRRDDYILGRLFKNANISGALKHDKIESDCTADYKVVESEAEKVARDAIRVLRESRRMCLSSTSGIPNWTGRHGQVAAQPRRLIPKNRARAQQVITTKSKQASNPDNSLLSSIKKRNHSNPVALAPRGTDRTNDDDSEEEERNRDFAGRAETSGADTMAEKIREFVLYKSSIQGEAQTKELLDFFKKSFQPDQTALFKAVLYKLCDLHRRGDKGFWRLKSEFRDLTI